MTYKIILPGNPVPAARPRVPRFGKPYYAKTYANWKKQAEEFLKKGPGELPGPLEVTTIAVFKKARTSKLRYPRADNDNLEKAAWDVITRAGGYWHDDNDIVTNHTDKRFARPGEEPCVIIEIEQKKDYET